MAGRSPFSARSFADRAAARRRAPDQGEPEDLAKPTPAPQKAQAPTQIEPRAPSGLGAQPQSDPSPSPLRSDRASPVPRSGLSDVQSTFRPRAAEPKRGAASRLPAAAKAKADRKLVPNPGEGALRLLPLQALTKGGRWRTEAMRSYRFPVLLWFTRGQGRITLAGLTRGYGAHNAIFVPPRVMHGFEVTSQVFGTAVFFSETPDIPLPQTPLHLRIRDAIAQGEVTTILEQLGREIDGDRPGRERAIHHQAGLLSVWIDRQTALTEDHAPETASLRLARRFTDAVEAQLYTAQGVSDYAEALGVTPTHLSRVCRETCGRSASDILADRLTYEARRLLAETAMPVKQVASLLGYGSAAYFTRAFQNRTGQTPTQFRAAA